MQNLGLIGFVIILAASARWFWRAWQVKIPSTPTIFQMLLATGLVLGVISIYLGQADAFAPWSIGLAAFLLYLTATGAQKVADGGIQVGDTIPAFTAPDDDGNEFDSASLAGSRVLIKFFRGHW